MGKKSNNRKSKKVSLKFYVYADDIIELKKKLDNTGFIEEFEDFDDSGYKHDRYVINNYITLHFENGRTYIYIAGQRFLQCLRLIIHIPQEEVEKYDEINSIDDAIAIYKKSLYQNKIIDENHEAMIVQGFTHNISPEEEFRGHCSNIQAWAENDYNTCILHSNIAFPMLKKLVDVGDPKARKVFKEEIAIRYEMGDKKFRYNLKVLGYLNYLSKEELQTLMEISHERSNLHINRKVKSGENSLKSNAIYNFVSYYNNSKEFYEPKKSREFLESCRLTLIELYQDSFRNKNKPQSKTDIKNLIIKRNLLIKYLRKTKSEFYISGRLIELLKTLEVLIMHLDPDIIENKLNSFKI